MWSAASCNCCRSNDGYKVLFATELLPEGAEARVHLAVCVGFGRFGDSLRETTSIGSVQRRFQRFLCYDIFVRMRSNESQPLRLFRRRLDDLRLRGQKVGQQEVEHFLPCGDASGYYMVSVRRFRAIRKPEVDPNRRQHRGHGFGTGERFERSRKLTDGNRDSAIFVGRQRHCVHDYRVVDCNRQLNGVRRFRCDEVGKIVREMHTHVDGGIFARRRFNRVDVDRRPDRVLRKCYVGILAHLFGKCNSTDSRTKGQIKP